MSRHYELMQQAEFYLSRPAAEAHPAAPVTRPRITIAEDQTIDADCLNLVQRIFLMEAENPPRVAVFAGLHQGAGAQQLCIAAGQHLARAVRRPVCVVKADFSSNSESYDPIGSSGGLFDALALNEPIMNFCTPTQDDNLWVLGKGALAGGVPALLTAENLKARIAELRDTFDFVVIAGPPLDRFAEGLIFSQLADGVILVLESGATRREDSEMIVANLRSSNIPILAAVLNNFSQPIPQKLRRFI